MLTCTRDLGQSLPNITGIRDLGLLLPSITEPTQLMFALCIWVLSLLKKLSHRLPCVSREKLEWKSPDFRDF